MPIDKLIGIYYNSGAGRADTSPIYSAHAIVKTKEKLPMHTTLLRKNIRAAARRGVAMAIAVMFMASSASGTLTLLRPHTAHAAPVISSGNLSNVSPTPNNMTTMDCFSSPPKGVPKHSCPDHYGDQENPSTGAVSHILRNQASSTITQIAMSVYYPVNKPNAYYQNQRLNIFWPFNNDPSAERQCAITPALINNQTYATVMLTFPVGKTGRTMTYDIPFNSQNVCSSFPVGSNGNFATAHKNCANESGSSCSRDNNRFAGNYDAPGDLTAQSMSPDPATNGLYYQVKVDISLSKLVTQQSAQHVSFKIKSYPPSDPSGFGGTLIGMRALGSAPQYNYNYATLGEMYLQQEVSGYGDRLQYPFGLPCNQQSPLADQPVYVYDADNSQFGSLYFYITDNGRFLDPNEYVYDPNSSGMVPDLGKGSGIGGFHFLVEGESKSVSWVKIKLMLPNHHYMIHLQGSHLQPNPPADPYKNTPGYYQNENVLSVGPPFDSIFGDIICTAAKTPYLQVYGGDMAAGAYLQNDSQCMQVNGANILSWNRNGAPGDAYAGGGSQVGAYASGGLHSFASALPMIAKSNSDPPTGLSFANTGQGAVDMANQLYGGQFESSALPVNCSGYGLPSGSPPGVCALNANKQINTGNPINLNPGENPVYCYYKGKSIYIGKNIKYVGTGGWQNPSDIPSFKLVVVGGDIYIDQGVNELSGLYVAEPDAKGNGGNIYTCSEMRPKAGLPFRSVPTDAQFYAKCNNQLQIYGSFAAEQVVLHRTYTNNKSLDQATYTSYGNSEAGEEFIYGPWMWLPGSGGLSPTYNALTELPPVL